MSFVIFSTSTLQLAHFIYRIILIKSLNYFRTLIARRCFNIYFRKCFRKGHKNASGAIKKFLLHMDKIFLFLTNFNTYPGVERGDDITKSSWKHNLQLFCCIKKLTYQNKSFMINDCFEKPSFSSVHKATRCTRSIAAESRRTCCKKKIKQLSFY